MLLSIMQKKSTIYDHLEMVYFDKNMTIIFKNIMFCYSYETFV